MQGNKIETALETIARAELCKRLSDGKMVYGGVVGDEYSNEINLLYELLDEYGKLLENYQRLINYKRTLEQELFGEGTVNGKIQPSDTDTR